MSAAVAKHCKTCDADKPTSEFNGHPRTRDRLQTSCRDCTRERSRRWRRANPDRERAQTARWRRENPERQRETDRRLRIKYAYGLTVEEYEAAIAKGCAICGASAEAARMHLDHDHGTGAVRAALCEPCNLGLGLFADAPGRLRAAAAYIEEHST